MILDQEYIEFSSLKLGKGKINLQPDVSKGILEMLNKLEDKKLLQSFLRKLNYARPFIQNLSKEISSLFKNQI